MRLTNAEQSSRYTSGACTDSSRCTADKAIDGTSMDSITGYNTGLKVCKSTWGQL